MNAGTAALGEPQPVARVKDHRVPGQGGEIPLRLYHPGGDEPLPAVVFFHGGGWVVGNIETHDGYCRALAHAAGVIVASVDYRLAPEHPFPAGVEDAYAATCWVAKHASQLGADPKRLVVAGDSAGGNLAAAVALMARDRGGPTLALQLLIYPITDCNFETPSYRDNAEGYFLTRETMIWFWKHYLPSEADRRQAYASPLRAASLRGLPPALVLTAEYDPLRDEGEAYAQRLTDAGVSTKLIRYDGMIHGFVRRLRIFQAARTALHDVAAALRQPL
jgi:acetyl esterase